MRLDQTHHGHHFPAQRLAFSSDWTEIIACVLLNFSSLLFPAESLSFSVEEMLEKIIAMGKEAMTAALCVSIKHIMVIISRLRGSPLAWKRRKSLSAS